MLVDFQQTHEQTLFSVTLISTFKNDSVVPERNFRGGGGEARENLRGNGFALGEISKQKSFYFQISVKTKKKENGLQGMKS